MSKFIPPSAVHHERVQHGKRLKHGIKLGTHVQWPDDEGPYVVRKDKLEDLEDSAAGWKFKKQYMAEKAAKAEKREKDLAALQAKDSE